MDSVKDIKTLVHRASIVIAHSWPMTTFVHHNPIRSLEVYPFNEAIDIAQRFIGGQGYLPNDMYRQLVKAGRITSSQIDTAVESFIKQQPQPQEVALNKQTIRQFDVIRAHLLTGITPPVNKSIPAFIDNQPNSTFIQTLAQKLTIKQNLDAKTNNIVEKMTLATWCDQSFNTELTWLIDREMIKWCEAFLDEGNATWPMPYREQGFYTAWRLLAAKEWSPCHIANSTKKINALPESAEEALKQLLDALEIPEELRQDYLSHQLTALYGWASFIHWRSENSEYQWQKAYPIDLIQYLAVRLFYEKELVAQTCQKELSINGKFSEIMALTQNNKEACSIAAETAQLSAAWQLSKLVTALELPESSFENATEQQLQQLLDWINNFPESEHGSVWLNAYEAGYRKELISKIETALSYQNDDSTTRPQAQLMFCIDVRSEPFRRNLESVGHYETIGFAGFFGLPISCQAIDQNHETDQCPAIVQPAYTVYEVARDNEANGTKHNNGKNFIQVLNKALYDLKNHVLTPYIMVESIGWFFGWHLIERTFFSGIYRQWNKWFGSLIVPTVASQITADKDETGLGLTGEEQNTAIETALKTMGLTDNFARLVIVAGHTSLSDNNPYEAALNCGACGGNSGEPNARLFAALANKPSVREALAQNGIKIPEDTYFIGAVHNTTTDALELYDLEDMPDTHDEDIKNLKMDLKKAAVKNNLERCLQLPGVSNTITENNAVAEITRRSGDWSETRPEWGLSGNASFIIGNRKLTQNINLKGRAFLNSYNYHIDPTGTLLEGILMGPMVVGQWINAEHYFSATDPEVYGSGSKIYHNVVGSIGVMSGPQSDLRTGLPIQSVANGDLTYHEPLRLFVAIEAPRQRILDIVERQPVLKQLCDNQWIHLMAIDHDSEEKLHCYKKEQRWVPINNTALNCEKSPAISVK